MWEGMTFDYLATGSSASVVSFLSERCALPGARKLAERVNQAKLSQQIVEPGDARTCGTVGALASRTALIFRCASRNAPNNIASGNISWLHQPSGGFPLAGDLQIMRRSDVAIHIEFENAGHHDDRLRFVSILEHCKAKCLSAVDKQPAAEASLVLDHPVPPAVLADEEMQRPRTWHYGGRFNLFHDTSPC
jgi:hypothetical protein